MKFVMCVFLIFVAVAAAQFGDVYGPGVYGPGGLDVQHFAPLSAAVGRDPRQNTGPVVFPPSPPGNPSDTSGVVVGASGYGFVPPSGPGYFRFRFPIHHNPFFFK